MEESKDDRSVFKLKKEKWHERDNGGLKKSRVHRVWTECTRGSDKTTGTAGGGINALISISGDLKSD